MTDITEKELLEIIKIYKKLNKEDKNLWLRDGNTLYVSQMMREEKGKKQLA